MRERNQKFIYEVSTTKDYKTNGMVYKNTQ
jgi:hypothetical protein